MGRVLIVFCIVMAAVVGVEKAVAASDSGLSLVTFVLHEPLLHQSSIHNSLRKYISDIINNISSLICS
eukprot:m.2508 g.2508  ORF g.2508 m.2508 type:complete len:68 (-) comp2610_c0_seq1:5-208(-)